MKKRKTEENSQVQFTACKPGGSFLARLLPCTACSRGKGGMWLSVPDFLRPPPLSVLPTPGGPLRSSALAVATHLRRHLALHRGKVLLFLFLVGSLDSEESAVDECRCVAVPGAGRHQLSTRTVDLLILREFGTLWRTGCVCCCWILPPISPITRS